MAKRKPSDQEKKRISRDEIDHENNCPTGATSLTRVSSYTDISCLVTPSSIRPDTVIFDKKLSRLTQGKWSTSESASWRSHDPPKYGKCCVDATLKNAVGNVQGYTERSGATGDDSVPLGRRPFVDFMDQNNISNSLPHGSNAKSPPANNRMSQEANNNITKALSKTTIKSKATEVSQLYKRKNFQSLPPVKEGIGNASKLNANAAAGSRTGISGENTKEQTKAKNVQKKKKGFLCFGASGSLSTPWSGFENYKIKDSPNNNVIAPFISPVPEDRPFQPGISKVALPVVVQEPPPAQPTASEALKEEDHAFKPKGKRKFGCFGGGKHGKNKDGDVEVSSSDEQGKTKETGQLRDDGDGFRDKKQNTGNKSREEINNSGNQPASGGDGGDGGGGKKNSKNSRSSGSSSSSSSDNEDSKSSSKSSSSSSSEEETHKPLNSNPNSTHNLHSQQSGLNPPVGSIKYDSPWPNTPIVDKKSEFSQKGINVDVTQEAAPTNSMKNGHSSRIDLSINNKYQGSSTIHAGPGGGTRGPGDGHRNDVEADYPYYKGHYPDNRGHTFTPYGDGIPIKNKFPNHPSNENVYLRQGETNGQGDMGCFDNQPGGGYYNGNNRNYNSGGYNNYGNNGNMGSNNYGNNGNMGSNNYGNNGNVGNNNYGSNGNMGNNSYGNNGNMGNNSYGNNGNMGNNNYGNNGNMGNNSYGNNGNLGNNKNYGNNGNMGDRSYGNNGNLGNNNNYGNNGNIDNGNNYGNNGNAGGNNNGDYDNDYDGNYAQPQAPQIMPMPIPWPCCPPQCPPPPPPPPPPCCCCPKRKRKKKKKKKDCDKQWDMMSMYGMYTLFQQMFTSWQNQMTEQYERSRPKPPPQPCAVVMTNPCQAMGMMGVGGCCPPYVMMPGGGLSVAPRYSGSEPNPIFEVTGVEVRGDSNDC